jgi:hypothetical protein
MGCDLVAANCQNYTTLPVTRYIEIVQGGVTEERIDVSIYTDSDFSVLEQTDYLSGATFANLMVQMRIFYNYNSPYSAYTYSILDLKYMEI